jgi:hypothetical protein
MLMMLGSARARQMMGVYDNRRGFRRVPVKMSKMITINRNRPPQTSTAGF